MKAVVTRVREASVEIAGEVHGAIDQGFLVLLGVGPEDDEETCDRLAEKVWGPPSKAAATNRKRRERIGKALDEISKLHGWNVKIEGRGVAAKATIKRPLLLEQS